MAIWEVFQIPFYSTFLNLRESRLKWVKSVNKLSFMSTHFLIEIDFIIQQVFIEQVVHAASTLCVRSNVCNSLHVVSRFYLIVSYKWSTHYSVCLH